MGIVPVTAYMIYEEYFHMATIFKKKEVFFKKDRIKTRLSDFPPKKGFKTFFSTFKLFKR